MWTRLIVNLEAFGLILWFIWPHLASDTEYSGLAAFILALAIMGATYGVYYAIKDRSKRAG